MYVDGERAFDAIDQILLGLCERERPVFLREKRMKKRFVVCSCLLLRNLVERSFLSSSNLYKDDAFLSVLNWQSYKCRG